MNVLALFGEGCADSGNRSRIFEVHEREIDCRGQPSNFRYQEFGILCAEPVIYCNSALDLL